MIISDEDDTQKIKDPPVAVPTVRYPDRAATRRPFSPLPDYETSQALAFGGLNDSQVTLYKPTLRRRIFDSRIWRVAIISLVLYIFLTLAIGVPIIVHVRSSPAFKSFLPHLYSRKNTRTSRNTLTTRSLMPPWAPKNSISPYPDHINNTSGPDQSGIYTFCNNWTMIEYSNDASPPVVVAATERYVSPNGQFSIALNASCTNDLNVVQGAFYTGINPNQSVQDAVLSIIMQASSPDVFNRSCACTTIADNFTDLSLYVPDNLTSVDNILYNITLLFPQTTTPSQVNSFATLLPMLDQRFGSFDDNVTFHKVSIGGPVSRVTVDSLQANRLLVDTSLEPVTGTFHARTSLVISTIMASIVANISLYNDPESQFPTSLNVHTGNGCVLSSISGFYVAFNIVSVQQLDLPISLFEHPTKLPRCDQILSRAFALFPAPCPPTSSITQVLPPRLSNYTPSMTLVLPMLLLTTFLREHFKCPQSKHLHLLHKEMRLVTDHWVPGLERTFEMAFNSTVRLCGWIGWGMWRHHGMGISRGK
ncbi:hypothetical protein J3R82DRAFT_10440 [Butyriboletus roseoflavus]|nr:hypothetical protein J3R82DRAFT_10440 [Butyriboletus roseoflavus]